MTLPDEVARLFWDVDPGTVDLVEHRDFVVERIMLRGGWRAMWWLRKSYSTAELADYLMRKGVSRLPPRELAYWALVAGVDVPIATGGGRPRWAGP